MEIEEIIRSLNRKNWSSGDFQNVELTEVEKDFIQNFCPQKSLITYGTLAPGAPNHSVVEQIRGNWQRGILRGSLVESGWGADLGFFAFKPDASPAEQVDIKAFMLFSDELDAHWKFLDDFEGTGYRRVLAKFELENGQVGVGNIYAINEEKILKTSQNR